MSKKTIIKGTLILTIAGLLTKILGFYNRIFLTRLIGVVELGKYQLIFPLYLFIFALTSQGIATTLTKQISYYMGTESNDKAKYIFRFSLIISTVTSLIIALLIYCFSDFISLKLLKNSDCGELLRVITIAVPFVAAKACINAYFIGIDKPIYHGLSHLIEQIIRIGAAYLLSLMVFAELVNAKLAVKAVVIGELSATVLAVIFYAVIQNKYKKRIYKPNYISKKDRKLTLHYFIKDALPITVNNLIFTLFSTFEAIIMPARLYFYYGSSDKALEMFGIITGIVLPFILFPSTITTSLSTMLLPAVSYANAKNDVKTINKALKNCILFCLVLGIGALICFMLFGEAACTFAFKSKEAGVLLKKLCFLCPLIYISGNLTAILNGIDRSFFALMCNVMGISIRIFFIFILVPRYGLNAYAAGMFASYTTINLLMLLGLKRQPVFSSTTKDKPTQP